MAPAAVEIAPKGSGNGPDRALGGLMPDGGSHKKNLRHSKTMQVITCMPRDSSRPPRNTRQRLLQAAVRVYARDGLTGATTRAIAHEAGVNEVTLFRHFRTKDRLLSAVVGENFGAEGEVGNIPIPPVTANLRSDLTGLVRCYDVRLTTFWPLVRTMLGEMHLHLNESNERKVFRAIFHPLKEAVISRIKAAQRSGEIRRSESAELLSDLLLGAIFTGVLRRSMSHLKIEYSTDTYLENAVAMFLDGVGAKRERP